MVELSVYIGTIEIKLADLQSFLEKNGGASKGFKVAIDRANASEFLSAASVVAEAISIPAEIRSMVDGVQKVGKIFLEGFSFCGSIKLGEANVFELCRDDFQLYIGDIKIIIDETKKVKIEGKWEGLSSIINTKEMPLLDNEVVKKFLGTELASGINFDILFRPSNPLRSLVAHLTTDFLVLSYRASPKSLSGAITIRFSDMKLISCLSTLDSSGVTSNAVGELKQLFEQHPVVSQFFSSLVVEIKFTFADEAKSFLFKASAENVEFLGMKMNFSVSFDPKHRRGSISAKPSETAKLSVSSIFTSFKCDSLCPQLNGFYDGIALFPNDFNLHLPNLLVQTSGKLKLADSSMNYSASFDSTEKLGYLTIFQERQFSAISLLNAIPKFEFLQDIINIIGLDIKLEAISVFYQNNNSKLSIETIIQDIQDNSLKLHLNNTISKVKSSLSITKIESFASVIDISIYFPSTG
jgi:hypothetical protein